MKGTSERWFLESLYVCFGWLITIITRILQVYITKVVGEVQNIIFVGRFLMAIDMGKWWLKAFPRCWAQDQGTKSGQNRKRGSEHWQNLAKLVRGWSRTLGCATGIHCIQSILVFFWVGRELSSKICAASPKSDLAIFDWRRYRDIVCQNPHYIVPNSKKLLEDDSTLSYLLLRWKFYMCADLPGYLKINWRVQLQLSCSSQIVSRPRISQDIDNSTWWFIPRIVSGL